MSKIKFAVVMIGAAAMLVAQGPPPGRFGGGGFGGGFGGRGFGLLGAGPGPRSVVTGAPYSATETITTMQALNNGNQISQKQQTMIYRDSQGRVRTEQTITPPAASGRAPFTRITIFDPVAGYEYVLDSATMTGRQMTLPKRLTSSSTGSTTTRPTPPANPNITSTSLGTQVINGVPATGTQVTDTIPAGAIGNAQPIQSVRITWISTDLKVPVEIKTNDPRFGNSDMELTNIVQAEPNASLFVVPAGYTVQQGGRGGPGGPRGGGKRQPPPAQ